MVLLFGAFKYQVSVAVSVSLSVVLLFIKSIWLKHNK